MGSDTVIKAEQKAEQGLQGWFERAGAAAFNGKQQGPLPCIMDFHCYISHCTARNSMWSGFIFRGRTCPCFGISNRNTATVFKVDLSRKFSLGRFCFGWHQAKGVCVWNAPGFSEGNMENVWQIANVRFLFWQDDWEDMSRKKIHGFATYWNYYPGLCFSLKLL